MTRNGETIAIAGAGIGGLSTALALAKHGLVAHVFERRTGTAEEGAGIQLGPNATRILDSLGVLDTVRNSSSEPDALSVHDGASGRVFTRLPLGAQMQARFGAPYLAVHRHDLHAALVSEARTGANITISPGQEAVDFRNRDGGVEVVFANGESTFYNALIAADGLWSRLRNKIDPSASTPKPYGKCAYRTVVPADALPKSVVSNDVHIWLNPGAHIVHYPVRQGTEHALVVIVDGADSAPAWGTEAAGDALKLSDAKNFARPLRDLIFGAQKWRMWPLQTLAPLARWIDGAVALLGDAAHPLLPFFAQGGGMAIEDAAVVAQSIANSTMPMPQRLRAYETARRSRVARVTDASRTNGRIYHLSGVPAFARNAVLSNAPGSLLMRRYDWLYGWAP